MAELSPRRLAPPDEAARVDEQVPGALDEHRRRPLEPPSVAAGRHAVRLEEKSARCPGALARPACELTAAVGVLHRDCSRMAPPARPATARGPERRRHQ